MEWSESRYRGVGRAFTRRLMPLRPDVSEVDQADRRGTDYSFILKDPEGHSIEFVQYLEGSLQSRYSGKGIPDRRISDHILHVGVHVKSPTDQDKLYKDILGFRFLWQGGPRDDRLDWISYLTPDGDSWIEYMVEHDGPPTPRQLGVWHHVCLGTLDIQTVYKTVIDRGYKPPKEPGI